MPILWLDQASNPRFYTESAKVLPGRRFTGLASY